MGQTDRPTDRQDPQCGLSGRPHNKNVAKICYFRHKDHGLILQPQSTKDGNSS